MAFEDYAVSYDDGGNDVNLEKFLQDVAKILASHVHGTVSHGRSDETVGVEFNRSTGRVKFQDIYFYLREDDFSNTNPDDPDSYQIMMSNCDFYINIPAKTSTKQVINIMKEIDSIRDEDATYNCSYYDQDGEVQDGYPDPTEKVTGIDVYASWGMPISTGNGFDTLDVDDTANNYASEFNNFYRGIESYFGQIEASLK